ncbi:hypothetical protein BDK92_1756 [Micromonospora pisi]|uniref:Uncharacterized protein n=1 Tax=Micromonospora pisi TaxID=589240 RepID=A0A495JFY9_9ACTN|nr:hypothetical protein BDK92_1756 [Micromonospora pisi]
MQVTRWLLDRNAVCCRGRFVAFTTKTPQNVARLHLFEQYL